MLVSALAIYHSLRSALATVSKLIDAGPEKAGVGGSIPSLATI
jgi:hypothetical protein